MISINVTSDSSVSELQLVAKMLDELAEIKVAKVLNPTAGLNLETREFSSEEIAKEFNVPIEHWQSLKDTALDNFSKGLHDAVDRDVFNATELAEAESLGKSAPSTVDASQSTTAHVDMTVNTSIPTPQSVFGQPVATNANVEVPVAPATINPAVDAKGRVWDARIHSSAKSFVKDGTWKYKKGVSDELIAQVEGNVPVPPVLEHTVENFEKLVEHSVAHIASQTTFAELLDMVTSAMVAGKLTQDELSSVLNSVGVPALPLLMGKPELIAEVERLLNK